MVRRQPRGWLATALALLLLQAAIAAGAEEEVRVHEVRLVDVASDGDRFAFEPKLLRIAPGERVSFGALRGHGSQSIPGMVPEGGSTWRTGIGRETEVLFDVEGVYGYLCRGHYTMGMVGLIVVGDPSANLEEAQEVRHPERAHRVFETLFDALEAETAAPPVN
jgi:pseudoazurin